MTDLSFRPAALSDVPALHALVERAYRGDEARMGWSHEADLLGGQRTDAQGLVDIVEDRDRVILLAHEGDSLVGCVMLARQADGSAYLGLLSVDPGRQAGGLGRLLLEVAEGHAATQFRADRIEMTVIRQRPELIAWYERRGYRLTGATAAFPLADERFGLPKRDDLEFVILAKALE